MYETRTRGVNYAGQAFELVRVTDDAGREYTGAVFDEGTDNPGLDPYHSHNGSYHLHAHTGAHTHRRIDPATTMELLGCTGVSYPINPDCPNGDTDVRHEGPCPAHL